MKNVISVDTVLDDSYMPIKVPDMNRTKLKQGLHSLLISKLPDTPENKAVLDELFEVKK